MPCPSTAEVQQAYEEVTDTAKEAKALLRELKHHQRRVDSFISNAAHSLGIDVASITARHAVDAGMESNSLGDTPEGHDAVKPECSKKRARDSTNEDNAKESGEKQKKQRKKTDKQIAAENKTNAEIKNIDKCILAMKDQQVVFKEAHKSLTRGVKILEKMKEHAAQYPAKDDYWYDRCFRFESTVKDMESSCRGLADSIKELNSIDRSS